MAAVAVNVLSSAVICCHFPCMVNPGDRIAPAAPQCLGPQRADFSKVVAQGGISTGYSTRLIESEAMAKGDPIMTENYNLRLRPTGGRKVTEEVNRWFNKTVVYQGKEST